MVNSGRLQRDYVYCQRGRFRKGAVSLFDNCRDSFLEQISKRYGVRFGAERVFCVRAYHEDE